MDELTILVAVTDSAQNPLHLTGPDDQQYPVLRPAPPSPFLDRLRETARTSFIRQAVRLDRCAQQFVRHAAAPVYLFLSDEDGGYARQGFWLEDAGGKRSFMPEGYINMVVDDVRLERGYFESTLVHELAHLTLRTLVGEIPPGPSRTPHHSMSVTDYPTALDEGWAEHMEAVDADYTENPWLLGRRRGAFADLIDTWVDEVDSHLRQTGLRQNLFVHEKPLPESALAPCPDPFQVWLDGENMGCFLPERLKTGQAMLSSEGVVATLFYRLVTDQALRDRWHAPAFYAQFLPPGTPMGDPQALFSPYENATLKLFAAVRQLDRPLDPHRLLPVDLVRAYAALFPDDTGPLYRIYLDTTWGATVSREVASQLEQMARQGHRGNVRAFQASLDEAVKALRGLHADLLAGRAALDANVGPELWLLNQAFLVPENHLRSADRPLPYTVNLNTASVPELMTLGGIDLRLARSIAAKRHELGFFTSVDDLAAVPGITPSLLASLKVLHCAPPHYARS